MCLLALSFLLAGCFHYEPQIFGVDQSVWLTLSEAERVAVIEGYNQKKAIEEANRPANRAIGAAQSLLTPLSNSHKYK